MAHWVGIGVHTIQIETLCIVSPVATLNSIRVQQGDNLEDEFVQKHSCLRPICSHEIEHAL